MFQKDWFIIKEAVPVEYTKIVRAWDFAASKKDTSKFTAGVKIGLIEKTGFAPVFVVLHVKRVRETAMKTEEAIIETVESDGHDVIQNFPIDPGAAGLLYINSLRQKLHGYPVIATPEKGGDKFTRAIPYSAACEAGSVYLKKAAWNTDYIDELCVAPNGVYTDQLDGSSRGYNFLKPAVIDYRTAAPVLDKHQSVTDMNKPKTKPVRKETNGGNRSYTPIWR